MRYTPKHPQKNQSLSKKFYFENQRKKVGSFWIVSHLHVCKKGQQSLAFAGANYKMLLISRLYFVAAKMLKLLKPLVASKIR